MQLRDFAMGAARKVYRAVMRPTFSPPLCDCDRQSSNDKLFRLLSSGEPCMVARFGTVEINTVNNYLCVHGEGSLAKRCCSYITGYTHMPWWRESHFKFMRNNAGVFGCDCALAERFSERYLADIPLIDLLACHQYLERYMPLRADVERVQLEMLYPFFVERPWTRVLRGKKVLVVHPFEETIRQQYAGRARLFANPDVLPDFEFQTLKAVQTVAGVESTFPTWFDALHFMEDEISARDFDVALIGCGAYGLPLAAHVKRIGKQALHIGGGLQLFFGILGNRWVKQYPQKKYWHYRDQLIDIDYTPLFNAHWIYPLSVDTPQGAQKVEGACYWK